MEIGRIRTSGMRLTTLDALAMRQRRHALAPRVDEQAADIVDRVIAVRAWPIHNADLSVTARQDGPHTGGADAAVETGELIRAYAFRGGSYLFTPDTADLILAVRQVTRVWETARFQHQGAFTMDSWDPLREEMDELLSDGPKAREEIAAHLAAIPRLRHLETGALGHGSDSLYKPLHWWGDICFGPARDGAVTFRRRHGPRPLPRRAEIDAAGRALLQRYLRAYGPVSPENLRYWLTEGLSVPAKHVAGWIDDLGLEVVSIDLDGDPRCVLASDMDRLEGDRPDATVRLLPSFDPWIGGPGTADPLIVEPGRRALLSRGADFLIVGGVVSGVWRKTRRTVAVDWFTEAGPPPHAALGDEVNRLAHHLGEDLTLAIG